VTLSADFFHARPSVSWGTLHLIGAGSLRSSPGFCRPESAGSHCRAPRAGCSRSLRCALCCILVLGVRLQYESPHSFLRRRISDRAQQRKAAASTLDCVLVGWEGDVAAGAALSLPDGEPDQLQAAEHAVGETQPASASLPGASGRLSRVTNRPRPLLVARRSASDCHSRSYQ
jgi:hypothetical protein